MTKVVRTCAVISAVLTAFLICTKLNEGESVMPYVSALTWQCVCIMGYGVDYD